MFIIICNIHLYDVLYCVSWKECTSVREHVVALKGHASDRPKFVYNFFFTRNNQQYKVILKQDKMFSNWLFTHGLWNNRYALYAKKRKMKELKSFYQNMESYLPFPTKSRYALFLSLLSELRLYLLFSPFQQSWSIFYDKNFTWNIFVNKHLSNLA